MMEEELLSIPQWFVLMSILLMIGGMLWIAVAETWR